MSPTDSPAILDGNHLERMTLGDANLAAEVLALFARQSDELVRVISAETEGANAAAHKLKGSARAIGAFAVERAVAVYEEAVADRTVSIAALNRSVGEVNRAIELYLAKRALSSVE